MSQHDSTQWMWAQACELLNRAERMQRQFFHPGIGGRAHTVWEPPADVFEDAREITVVIALPGVPPDSISIAVEPGALVLRAQSRVPFSVARGTVLRLEIPYGNFERRIPLPNIGFSMGTQEFVDGCLILRLHKMERS